MPILGTAPRRVSPGVWKTRAGRTLTPAGGAYWENLYRIGRTDGSGHMLTQSLVEKTVAPSPKAQAPRGPQLQAGRPGQARGRAPSTSKQLGMALESQLGRGALA